MSNSSNSNNQEIDLLILLKSAINNIKLFIQRNILAVIILSIIGAALGYFISANFKKYESRIIIAPNFNSTEYLYNEIDFINSKIQDKDSVFLKGIGFDKTVSKIEIKPIISVYQFIQSNEKNFDLLKLFAEDGDINKVAEDDKTAKNYSNHQVTITTATPNFDRTKTNLLFKYLNRNEYYNDLKNISNKNLDQRIITNTSTVNQINQVLDKFSEENSHEKSSNLVYFNDNTQLNEIIITKNHLIKENEMIIQGKLTYDKTIKEIAQSLNIIQKSNSKLIIIILPIVLILFYFTFKQFFKKNTKK